MAISEEIKAICDRMVDTVARIKECEKEAQEKKAELNRLHEQYENRY